MIRDFLFDGFEHSSGRDAECFVLCRVRLLSRLRGGMPEEKVADAMKILAHIGRWEQLASAISDLGLCKQVNHVTASNKESYEIESQIEPLTGDLKVSFCLKESEALRRAKGTSNSAELDVDEIYSQVKNIPKWSEL